VFLIIVGSVDDVRFVLTGDYSPAKKRGGFTILERSSKKNGVCGELEFRATIPKM
jgi:hypothetical protein